MKTSTLPFTLCSTLVLGLAGCYDAADPREMDGSSEGGDDMTTGDLPDPSSASSDPTADTGDGETDTGIDPPEPGNAMIRVIHGSPGAPAVDIYVAGTDAPVISALEYGEASDYLEVPAGTYAFEVRAADTGPTDAPVYSTGNLELADGAMISALAAGRLDAEGGAAFRVIPLVEDFEEANAGQTRVRIVHAGADAPAVGLDVGNDGTEEVSDLARFSETGAGGVALPSGESMQLAVRIEDTTFTSFTLPELPDSQGLIVIATGLASRLPRETDGFALLAIAPTGSLGFIKQNPTVYALHAGPDAPEVDLCAGDTTLASHISFGDLAAVQVPPGSYQIDAYVAPSGCVGTPALTDESGPLQAGERYLVVATGELGASAGEPPLQLQAYTERFDVDQPDQAALRLVHAASAPEVDVGIVTGGVIENGNVISTGLKWPDETPELMVPPLTYQLGVAGAGGATPITPLVDFHVPVDAGQRAFVVAAGDVFPESTEAHFRLIAVDTATNPWSIASIDPNP